MYNSQNMEISHVAGKHCFMKPKKLCVAEKELIGVHCIQAVTPFNVVDI